PPPFPYTTLFRSLRMGNRLCELGLIRLREAPRSPHTAHTALAIEEWLGGGRAGRRPAAAEPAGHVVIRKSDIAVRSRPPSEMGGRRKKRRRGRGGQTSTAPPPEAGRAAGRGR